MDNVIAPKVDGLKPLPVRPAAAAPAPAAPSAAPAAPATIVDAKQVNVGPVGLDAPSRTAGLSKGVPEVDFSAVEAEPKAAPEKPEAPSLLDRAMGFFGSAFSLAQVVVNPMTLLSDQSFLEKVKHWFTGDGNETLKRLSTIGKLAALDANKTSLKGVIGKLLEAGVDPKLIEILNKQVLNPGAIEQMDGKMTCAVAVLQKLLAERNPGAYAQAAQELVSTGKTTLPNGAELAISPENMAWLKQQNLSPEAMVNAVFQVALLESAIKPATYDVATDTISSEISIFGMEIEIDEKGGSNFGPMAEYYAELGLPLFDPRKYAEGTDAEKTAALKAALAAAQQSGVEGVSVPVHSTDGRQEKYHMVQVTAIDDNGNVTVFDPKTQKETTYTQAEFLALVGWDITAVDNVGGGRPRPSGGGGTGSV